MLVVQNYKLHIKKNDHVTFQYADLVLKKHLLLLLLLSMLINISEFFDE